MDDNDSLVNDINDINYSIKKMELDIETKKTKINNLIIEKKKLQNEYDELVDIRLKLAIELEEEKEQNKMLTSLNDGLLAEINFYKEIITNLAKKFKLTENDLKKIMIVQNNDHSDNKRQEIFNFINKIMENYKRLEEKNIEYETRFNEYEKIQKQNDNHIKVQIEEQTLANNKANALNIKIETMIKNYDTQILEIIDLFNKLK